MGDGASERTVRALRRAPRARSGREKRGCCLPRKTRHARAELTGRGYVSPKAADYACALAAGLKVWVLGFEVFSGFGAETLDRSSS